MNTIYKYDILQTHNDYDISSSRTKLEEIKNDPFGLGNNVKGLANLNHQRNLSNYAEDLVSQYAKYTCDQYELSLDMLPEHEQYELARLYIEFTEREITECVNGDDFSINNDYTCALLSMLKHNSKETREKFAQITMRNILVYYKESIQETLDDACHFVQENEMEDQGFYASRDMEHGDIVWRKCS